MVKNKEKYLISLDLDGTLLKDDKTISKSTARYLKKLEKQGNLVVLNTGRAPRQIEEYYKFLKINSPLIAYNGALIMDPRDDSFKPIEHKIDKEFTKTFYKNNIGKTITAGFCENLTTIYYDSEDEFLFTFFTKSNLKLIKGRIDENIDQDTFIFVMKLVPNLADEDREKMSQEVKKLNPNYRIRFWWDYDYAEIHFSDISKADSLMELVKKENIKMENVLTFGDAGNDIEMLTMFPNGFFMKNGAPQLRGKARFTTEKDNNHNGVKYALKKYFKKVRN